MRYARTKVEGWDWVPGRIERGPEVPTIKFKKNGVTYTAPDLRLLNETAVSAVEYILGALREGADNTSLNFSLSPECPDSTLQATIDILLGMEFSAEKKGKNSWSVSSHLLNAATTTAETDLGTVLTVTINEETAQDLHEFQEGREDVPMDELVIFLAGKARARMMEWGKENT